MDVCDLATGLVRQVIGRGRAEVLPFDVARGRKLSRYLVVSVGQEPAEGGAPVHRAGGPVAPWASDDPDLATSRCSPLTPWGGSLLHRASMLVSAG